MSVRSSATAVILAAGMGTRMRSKRPKAAHSLAGRPMLRHLIESCAAVFDRQIIVIGPDMDELAQIAAPHRVVLSAPLGTAYAALQAADGFGEGDVAILYADSPLILPDTLRRLRAARAGADLVLLTMRVETPNRYGRVLRDQEGRVTRIVEWADATDEERAEPLCNAGVFCARAPDLRRWLRAVENANAAGEYYLTDIVALAHREGAHVVAVETPEEEVQGVNARAELARAESVLQKRLRLAAMENGATLVAPDTVFFSFDTRLAPDCWIGPHVVFGPGVVVESGAAIRAFSHLEGCHVAEGATIGPYARLRPGTVVEQGAHVGNFVELKAARLGRRAKANHLAYLGDAEIGDDSNIGAGVITANYDGHRKHRTVIGQRVFVGSNATLVAPLEIGDDSLVAGGSTILHAVEENSVAFGRARQVNKPGLAALFRARRGKGKEKGERDGG